MVPSAGAADNHRVDAALPLVVLPARDAVLHIRVQHPVHRDGRRHLALLRAHEGYRVGKLRAVEGLGVGRARLVLIREVRLVARQPCHGWVVRDVDVLGHAVDVVVLVEVVEVVGLAPPGHQGRVGVEALVGNFDAAKVAHVWRDKRSSGQVDVLALLWCQIDALADGENWIPAPQSQTGAFPTICVRKIHLALEFLKALSSAVSP